MFENFKVVALSSNTNSFGLTQFVAIARDGKAFKSHRYQGLQPLAKGQVIGVPLSVSGTPQPHLLGFEATEILPVAPRDVVEDVWNPKSVH